MQNKDNIRELFERYRDGKCSPEEIAKLHQWFNYYARNEADGLEKLLDSFDHMDQKRPRRRIYALMPYAAAILMVLGIAGYFYSYQLQNNSSKEKSFSSHTNDVLPGGNKALLTLSDGTVIQLDSSHSGIVTDGSKISYASGKDDILRLENAKIHQLILSTPKGGTYQLTLPDGSKVWLNADSKLHYPSQFSNNMREVEIEGEAYFSVVKDKNKPFRVKSLGQVIEVLGTEFNVSTYSDDSETKTTLVSGSIHLQPIGSKRVISVRPGEQVHLSTTGNVSKNHVDVQIYTAWKRGEFYFDNTPLNDMMKQLARWYDMEVKYEKSIPNERFSGSMSRQVTLQTVLNLLKVSEIKYRIEANTLIIE